MKKCFVPYCYELGNHKLPKDPKLRTMWLKAIRRENIENFDEVRLCRNHFTSDDFQKVSDFTGLPNKHKYLKRGVVPSIFPWDFVPESELAAKDIKAKKKRRKRKIKVEENPVDPLSLPEIKHEEVDTPNDLSSEATEISLLCRLCAQFSNQNTPITSEIIVMIKSILNIDDDAHFPQFLCSDCNDNLIRSYQFQQNSLHAVQKLRTMMEANSTTIVDVRTLIKDELISIENETICSPSDAKKPRLENLPINDDSNLTDLNLPKKHIESHKTNFEYLCKVCNLKFQDYNVYKDHVKTHNSAPKFQYICKHCPAVFTDFNMYKNHTKEEHTSNMGEQSSRQLKCNSCTRRFFSIVELKTHAKLHLNEIFQCNNCSENFSSLEALNQHESINHNC